MLTPGNLDERNRQIEHILNPEQKRSFLGVTLSEDSLAGLTLRQLRKKASEIAVPLYSRKTKARLIKEISSKLDKTALDVKEDINSSSPFWSLNKSSTEAGGNFLFPLKTNTKVVFLPRDPEWAYVFWHISESDRKRAQSHKANRLCLRLLDVTGVEAGTSNRQTLQEVQVDSHNTEWYLPIPMSDRDYRVEIGYRSGSKWISLGFSSVARVPLLQPSGQVLDQFVPFSLEGDLVTTNEQQISESFVEHSDTGLHERLYRSATNQLRNIRIGSEEFQENPFSRKTGLNDSGVGVWASGRNQSGLGGVAPREGSFWLVADAELIVYGSTDPAAKLKIGDQEVPLSSDGTFRLQVPFRDGVQKYPIEASVEEDGQKRNITMQFERITPEDNTNPNENKKGEWF